MSISLEQELNLRLFAEGLKQLNETESKELLVKMFRDSMVQHNIHKELLAKKWGIK